VLEISASPYNKVVLPPSLDDLREFFRAVPQGVERSTAIRIGALSSTHRMLAKIVQQNIWPVARRSDLILKRAPVCLCNPPPLAFLPVQAHFGGYIRGP